MELMTITQVSKDYNISTRMLRYYENAGLIKSQRAEDYAYRVYDQDTITRIRQILLLRKLRIPLKQIKIIVKSDMATLAIEVFEQNIAQLDREITALSTIRGILSDLVHAIESSAQIKIKLLEQEEGLLQAIDSLARTSINFKEDQTMENLNQANQELGHLRDVRIVHLPPATVASSHVIGDDPELHAGLPMQQFVLSSGLREIKPDLRMYGFNHPNPSDESGRHGYEIWVTIPDDMEVPAPLTKKRFEGGLYAAHMIQMGNFQEWDMLIKWVMEQGDYEFAGDFEDQEHMCGLIEEHLNYYNHVLLENIEPESMQLDLLVPIRETKSARG